MRTEGVIAATWLTGTGTRSKGMGEYNRGDVTCEAEEGPGRDDVALAAALTALPAAPAATAEDMITAVVDDSAADVTATRNG